jgi:predicted SnoaL-like aldol condensation-catalyzing enzyme
LTLGRIRRTVRQAKRARRTAVDPTDGNHTPGGFEAFVQFVEGFAQQFPQMSLEIKRAVAEGDMVVTHSLLKTSPQDRGTAAADFFRLEDGKVVEHWDVLQPVPESAANDHPMF